MREQAEKEQTSQVAIKPASALDLPAIERILRATIQTPYGSGNVGESELAEIQAELDRVRNALESPDEGDVLIAEPAGGEGIGFAFFGKPDKRLLDFTHSDAASTLELRILYLDPQQRERGIGTQLLNSVEESAKHMGMSTIELVSGPRFIRIGSAEFYKKNGYSQLGVIRNYFEEKYPAWVFQKHISQT